MGSKDNDKEETSNTVSTSKLAWLKQRLVELKALEIEVNTYPDKQVSQTDPDARLMKTHHMQRQICYNVQGAVDTKPHLIVAHDIVMTTDRGQLTLVADKVGLPQPEEPTAQVIPQLSLSGQCRVELLHHLHRFVLVALDIVIFDM
jgi:hypothetical protein